MHARPLRRGPPRSPLDGLRRRIDDDDVAVRLVAETLMVRHGFAPRHRDAVLAEVGRAWPLALAWLRLRYGRADDGVR